MYISDYFVVIASCSKLHFGTEIGFDYITLNLVLCKCVKWKCLNTERNYIIDVVKQFIFHDLFVFCFNLCLNRNLRLFLSPILGYQAKRVWWKLYNKQF